MKKLLFVNDLIYGGGVEKVMADLVAGLSKEEYDITVYSEVYSPDFHQYYGPEVKYVSSHVIYHQFTLRNEFFRKCFRRLLYIRNCLRKKQAQKRLSKKNFDVAVAFKEGSSMQFVDALSCPKKLAWIHTDYQTSYWTENAFGGKDNELSCLKRFDRVVCVSEAARKSLIEVLGDPGNLCVRYSPMDDENIRQKAEESLSLSRRPVPLFVSVGRLVKEKGCDRLLSATKRLYEEGYTFDLWLVGGGPEAYVAHLKERVAAEGLSNVSLFGDQKNPYPFLTLADCFVSATYAESYGLSIQEAMILGVPVLVTACPAILETISRDAGVICENSEEGVYLGMKDLLDHPEKLTKAREFLKNEGNDFYQKRIERIQELF